jgi:hypothetical protein
MVIEPDRLDIVKGHACAYLRLKDAFSSDTLDAVDYIIRGYTDLVQSISSATAKVVVEAMRTALVEVCGGVSEAPGEILERYNYAVSHVE